MEGENEWWVNIAGGVALWVFLVALILCIVLSMWLLMELGLSEMWAGWISFLVVPVTFGLGLSRLQFKSK